MGRCRSSCKIDKEEGGESQLDVGGKNGHRLSPIHYTSIAEIKGFRFKLEKTFLHTKVLIQVLSVAPHVAFQHTKRFDTDTGKNNNSAENCSAQKSIDFYGRLHS